MRPLIRAPQSAASYESERMFEALGAQRDAPAEGPRKKGAGAAAASPSRAPPLGKRKAGVRRRASKEKGAGGRRKRKPSAAPRDDPPPEEADPKRRALSAAAALEARNPRWWTTGRSRRGLDEDAVLAAVLEMSAREAEAEADAAGAAPPPEAAPAPPLPAAAPAQEAEPLPPPPPPPPCSLPGAHGGAFRPGHKSMAVMRGSPSKSLAIAPGSGGGAPAAAAAERKAPPEASGGPRGAMRTADESKWVRRSTRNVNETKMMDKRVQELLARLRSQDASLEMRCLKLKDFIPPDSSREVMEQVVNALAENRTVEALYIQAFELAMDDRLLEKLLAVLKSRCIWALNIGENFRITTKGWEKFTKALRKTSVTHMYMSEHVITPDLKTKMRDAVRANRRKHDRHIRFDNLEVIRRVTNMWWNPINAAKLQREMRERAPHGRMPPPAKAPARVGVVVKLEGRRVGAAAATAAVDEGTAGGR